jgi:hypothetical protein
MGGLTSNQTISILNLAHNKISDVGLRRITNYIQTANSVLMSLELNDNQITDQGIIYFAEALINSNVNDNNHNNSQTQTNVHLTTLNLALNQIGFQGCATLFKAVAVNESLQTLDLSCNRIRLFSDENMNEFGSGSGSDSDSSSAADALINMLAVNTCLKVLNLNGNPLLISNRHKQKNANSASVSVSVNSSRPVSRLSNSHSLSSNVSSSNRSIRSRNVHCVEFFERLEKCLLRSNSSLISFELLQSGFSRLELETISRILHPRKVKLKQSQRKNFVDQSWQRLQTVLTI